MPLAHTVAEGASAGGGPQCGEDPLCAWRVVFRLVPHPAACCKRTTSVGLCLLLSRGRVFWRVVYRSFPARRSRSRYGNRGQG